MLSTLLVAGRDFVRYLLLSWLQLLQLDDLGLPFLSEKAARSFSECLSLSKPTTQSLVFGPALSLPQTSIHAAFAHHAATHPDMLAVKHLSSTLTYRELDRLSDALAVHLRRAGVARGQRVALLVSRSPAMVVGVFAALKAGAAYVPLDGGIVTDETLRTILEDAKPTAVLCLSRFVRRMEGSDVRVVDIEEFVKTVDREVPEQTVEDRTQPEDEAYVIYTSGTTGRPKGVSVSHGNVTNLILSSPGNLTIRPGTRVSQLLNIAFDMCAWEVLGCLSNGGTLVLRPSGSSCADWEATLREVDVVIATPSILAQFRAREFPNVKVVATAGERCSQKLADEWAAGRTFWNCCGPTETTIINTAHLHTPGAPNTIGRPTPNNAVYVLDANLRPVPIGAPGTLWAGGRGVCRGYVCLPTLTEERFRPDPFCALGGVMYNTGDVGRLRADGELDHLGREDDQVKIKGFRVELDGVAAALSSCHGVSAAAALLVDSELCGFYAPARIPVEHVKTAVERVQPYYAVPARYVALEKMPLTRNGKVDKTALRARAEEDLEGGV